MTATPNTDGITVDNRPPLDDTANRELVLVELQKLRNRAEAKRLFDAEQHAEESGATWAPINLGPYLAGEITVPTPTLGVARSDGQKLIYTRREHAVIGETESGKSWFALMCAATELRLGRRVVYVHYEESDPASTIDRLRLLCVSDRDIADRLTFVGPVEQVRPDWLAKLLADSPTLVIHDGVNEAMALHGNVIKEAEGAAEFRRRLIKPCLAAGAATIACDHLPMGADHGRRDAYGSVHKGNALDGARFVMENAEPFGRGTRGVSHLFVTKDRPGHLRATGKATKVAGKTYLGTVVVDATGDTADPYGFYAPRADDSDAPQAAGVSAGDAIREVLEAAPDMLVESRQKLCAHLRAAGYHFRNLAVHDAVDDLVVSGHVTEVPGRRGAKGYRLASRPIPEAETQ